MKYNIYIKNFSGSFNILCITKEQLNIVVDAYMKALDQITISGKNYIVGDLHEIQIYEYDKTMSVEDFKHYCFKNKLYVKDIFITYIPPRNLAYFGKNITEDVIGNIQYGELKTEKSNNGVFVNANRISELKQIKSSQFDLSRLIRLCEELNDNFRNENYLSVGMIGRTIINHIPPIFKFSDFNQVANNHGGVSFKKSMQNLNNSLKNIADSFLHEMIRNSESLPNDTQVNFSQDLDVLLAEIVRILK